VTVGLLYYNHAVAHLLNKKSCFHWNNEPRVRNVDFLKGHSQQITVDWSEGEALMSLFYANGNHNFNHTFLNFVFILILFALLLNMISI
jgi:hypothetical protein